MSRAVMQQALEVLEYIHTETSAYEDGLIHAAITTLRAALAEPEQEPIAWMVYTLDGKAVCVTDNPNDFDPEHRALPLYTAPTPRKPLSEGEIYAAIQGIDSLRAVEVARAIERAHGITGESK